MFKHFLLPLKLLKIVTINFFHLNWLYFKIVVDFIELLCYIMKHSCYYSISLIKVGGTK